MTDFVTGGMTKDMYLAGKEVVRTIFHEFLVDLLGVFLPGIIFTAMAGAWTYAAGQT